jgi:nucleotide-binding universal stress UspA family protein
MNGLSMTVAFGLSAILQPGAALKRTFTKHIAVQEKKMTTLAPAKIAFERILVPTDFSDVSQRALEYAKHIANQYGSQILLTHVSRPIDPITAPEGAWCDNETAQRQIEEELEQRAAALRSEGFQERAISAIGAVQDEILSAASRENADLIVLGAHANTGIERLLYGSDAEALLRKANCPVLVVGPVAQPLSDRAWHPKHIVCASALNPDTALIAAYAYVLAREYQAKFTLLHVEDPTRRGESGALQFEKALAEALHNEPSPFLALQTSLSHEPGVAIVDFATDNNADLIVMGAHIASAAVTHLQRGVAPRVFAEAPCPVMVLHT